MPKSKKKEEEMSEAEKKTRREFDELSAQWEDNLKSIVFPKGKILAQDLPRWSGCTKPRLKIPIGPLVTMCAMYHWYRFLGRHLLREGFVELTNRVFIGIGIRDETISDHIENPKYELGEVLYSLDDENRHQLGLRCDRWFTEYLRTTPQAKVRAKHLLGL